MSSEEKKKIMKMEKDIWTLSANYLSGEMASDESVKFMQMLERKPDFKTEFEKIKPIWKSLGGKASPETNKSWEELHSRLKIDGLLDNPERKKTSFNFYLIRMAAIVIIGLMIAVAAHYFKSANSPSDLNSIHLSAVGNVNSYTLPDGSRVFLNNNSKLTYSITFNKNRVVKLKGEGFFEVMSDPENPFQIKTKNAVISVLGTKFNVKEKQNITEVLVESGKVQLQKNQNSPGIIMTQGDFGMSDGETESLELNSDMNYLSWKTREFIFSDNRLQDVIKVLEDSYHIEINIEDERIGDLKLTSSYSQQSIDAILKTICVVFDLSCTNNNNEYSLSKNK